MSIVSDEQHVDGLLSFWMIRVSGRDGVDSTHELDPIDEERERIWLLNKSPIRHELIKNNNNDDDDDETTINEPIGEFIHVFFALRRRNSRDNLRFTGGEKRIDPAAVLLSAHG